MTATTSWTPYHSPARVPILATMNAIDTELAQRDHGQD